MQRFTMTEARKRRGRHDVSELRLAWKRQKIREADDYSFIEYDCICDKPFEECKCE